MRKEGTRTQTIDAKEREAILEEWRVGLRKAKSMKRQWSRNRWVKEATKLAILVHGDALKELAKH